jgi:predicted DNA-binding ribbon-helix-helix protein
MKRHSLRMDGHQTSISIENEFWKALREIANERDISAARMVNWIDANRTESNLSSAVRVFVLQFYQIRVAEQKAFLGNAGAGTARQEPRMRVNRY